MSPGSYNTASTYGSVARAFHWLTALLILTEIPLGLYANRLPVSDGEALARAAFYFSAHKSLGVVIFVVALARIVWALRQPQPADQHPDRTVETLAASAVHWSLYLALVLVPLTGWLSHAASTGFAPIWGPIGQTLPLVPKSDATAHVFATLHVLFGKVLAVSILLHVAGALKHLLIDRDATFARMWSGKPSPAEANEAPKSIVAVLTALGAYTAAICVGLALGMFAPPVSSTVPTTRLPDRETGWAVQDGAIRITVRQLGSDVTGEFGDWSASIDFDPATGTGSVDVTIAIASLTLGQVTANALGTDFFDAQTHPTATFLADIAPDGQDFLATGQLTIKGSTVPVALPFSLQIEDNEARMTGTASVDRRDFGIGSNYSDESSVGFTVSIGIELLARRVN